MDKRMVILLLLFFHSHSFEYVAPEPDNTLQKIAICESGGDPLAKNPNSTARGLYQITEPTQRDIERWTGKKYDAFNAKDNEEMAIYLFNRFGTSRWESSRSCWAK